MQKYGKWVLLAVFLLLTACSYYDPYYHSGVGTILGGAAGAVIGHQLDHQDGRYYGGAVGALIGNGVGHYVDHQRLYYGSQPYGYAPEPYRAHRPYRQRYPAYPYY